MVQTEIDMESFLYFLHMLINFFTQIGKTKRVNTLYFFKHFDLNIFIQKQEGHEALQCSPELVQVSQAPPT